MKAIADQGNQNDCGEREFVILGDPQSRAVPKSRIRQFKIVRDVPVKMLVTHLRASSRRLWNAMGRWVKNGDRKNVRKDEASGKYILMDERVVACWNELCSRMEHLKIRDFGGIPITWLGDRLGGESHFDISRDDIECDGSAEALVERMMFKHASDQLYLFWHACYSEERLYVSKADYERSEENSLDSFMREPKDSEFAVRAGYAGSGEPVFEFVADTTCGNVGVFRWRALRDASDDFGVMRGIVRRFPMRMRIIDL